jgi:hypothetical protein
MTEDRLAEFLNKLNDLADGYGLVVGGWYELEDERLDLLMIKNIDTTKRRKGTPRKIMNHFMIVKIGFHR